MSDDAYGFQVNGAAADGSATTVVISKDAVMSQSLLMFLCACLGGVIFAGIVRALWTHLHPRPISPEGVANGEKQPTVLTELMLKSIPTRVFEEHCDLASDCSDTTQTPPEETAKQRRPSIAPSVASSMSLPSCPICLERYVGSDVLRKLSCTHEFHASCLDPWLTTRNVACPLCKHPAVDLMKLAETVDSPESSTPDVSTDPYTISRYARRLKLIVASRSLRRTANPSPAPGEMV
ncbi:hypothetical protein M427DRAFT_345513 [Gonapodya prolifera JEL478]|uniref:RING-type domain-containing protein n=1 Tax=Gonapodya prolifera (strain JEL478) TaxID=1344416 RepID=A0A139AW42_GONPJ|nr:hypothetical protein M427DRAFT_345513 [Gonapodya prolifera JEL478]|eukprot:KXS20803.1 hypothetical protein M427DRAFT_345513 [Gonapodya prolifera JEL478]